MIIEELIVKGCQTHTPSYWIYIYIYIYIYKEREREREREREIGFKLH